MTVDVGLREPPQVSGGEGEHGHLEELRVDPIALMRRVRDECGDVGQFRLADRDVVLLDRGRGQRAVLPRSGGAPRPGRGLPLHDADLRRGRGLRRPARAPTRDAPQPGPAGQVHAGPRRNHRRRGRGHGGAVGGAEGGTIDLLDWFAELTIYTSSACLIGRKFRHELDRRFAELYHDLEQGTDAIAYVDPYADHRELPPARRGPARARRAGAGHHGPPRRRARRPTDEDRDLLDVLMSIRDEDGTPKFSTDMVTGMFISMMFAGHHTTSGTAAWTLIELLRHPAELDAVRAELDELYAHGEEVSYQALRAMPRLESAIKEALRLHPAAHPGAARGQGGARGARGSASPRASWWGRAWRCRTASPRTSPTPTPSSPSATSSPGPRTAPTRGRGSPSVPVGTAAWGRPSP